MSAREIILDRIRRANSGGAGREAATAAWMRAEAHGAPRPAQGAAQGAVRLDQFEAKVIAASATLTRIADAAALPTALADLLRARNLPAAIRTGSDPLFRSMDWGGIERSEGVGRIEEPVTVSRAEFAMAETGTLVLASGPDNPVTLTFLGEHHFVAVRAEDVMGGFDDLWPAWRARGLNPRTINMVTGPSRSADIGQTLQLGAHGPVALHVFLIGG